MDVVKGIENRILEIDLTKRKFYERALSQEDRKKFLGGKGLALKLLYDILKTKTDPLGEENVLVITTSVLMGTNIPSSEDFTVATKSPLTDIIVTSTSSGSFGKALKGSRWDGCIITGKASTPVYVVINSKGAVFKPASKYWGKNTRETEKLLKDEGEGRLVIGQAGENLVRFANASSDGSFLNRGGIGAVMGSKNLKALVSMGGESTAVPVDEESFGKLTAALCTYIIQDDLTSFSQSSDPVALNNEAGLMPVRNFASTSRRDAETLYHTTFSAQKSGMPLEYETIGMLGSNLEIFDRKAVASFSHICETMGMDPISAGGTLAWAMEASEKGLFKSKLRFGSHMEIIKILKDIGTGQGIGKELAMGTRWLSRKYGGKDFAMEVKGLEMPPYDPRESWGLGLSYAVANRGACHLSTASFVFEQYMKITDPYKTKDKPFIAAYLENIFAAIQSMGMSHGSGFSLFRESFLMKLPRPILLLLMTHLTPIAMRLLKISLLPKLWSAMTGEKLGTIAFIKAGARIVLLERYMNTREGISIKDDILPNRMLYKAQSDGQSQRRVPLDDMLPAYYNIRGYDEEGIPLLKTLQRYNLQPGGN